MASYGMIYGMLYPPKKPPPTLYARIRRALQAAGPRGVVGRTKLTTDVLGKQFTLAQSAELNDALNDMIRWHEVAEAKRQLPGTGWEGPPVFEYVYTHTPILVKT